MRVENKWFAEQQLDAFPITKQSKPMLPVNFKQ